MRTLSSEEETTDEGKFYSANNIFDYFIYYLYSAHPLEDTNKHIVTSRRNM